MISIIIPTIGGPRKETLNSLLADIGKQTLKDREVVVIEGDDRQGRAINRGASRAKGEILVIMDDDTRLGCPDLLEKLIEVLKSDKTIGMVGASTIPHHEDSFFQKAALKQIPRRYSPVVNVVTESDMAHHPCCAIPKKIFEEVGGESEVLIRGLDPELRHRIRKHGYRIVIAPNAWIHHPLPESITGIFKMYYKNGKAAAYAYLTSPDLIFETPEWFRGPAPAQRTTFSYRTFRFIKNFIRNIITLRITALIAMAAYGSGYMAKSFAYKREKGRVETEYALYDTKYLLKTIKEVSGILLKDLFIKKDALLADYLKERLTLYSLKRLKEGLGPMKTIWIHGSSLGEVNDAIKLSKKLKACMPDMTIILSTAEPAAYNIARNAAGEICDILFLPFDLQFFMKRVFSAVRPKLFITICDILWPNAFRVLKAMNVNTMLLNGYSHRLNKVAREYMISDRMLKNIIKDVGYLGMRSQKSADGIMKLGADKKNLGVLGWLRLDLPVDFAEKEDKKKLLGELYLNGDAALIIAGSTWRGEEEIFLKAFKDIITVYPDAILILAPRHMRRIDEVCGLVSRAGLTPKKKTLLFKDRVKKGEVIILDTIGELYRYYGAARAAIVGGSFMESAGGGNIVEPLVRGCPIIIGPHTRLWEGLAEELKLRRAKDYEGLKRALTDFLKDPQRAAQGRDIALKIMEKERGSLERCVEAVKASIR